jgi:biotin carboxyl carrier protein
MQLRYQVGDETRTITIEREGERYRAIIDGRIYIVRVQDIAEATITFTVDDKQLQAYLASQKEQRYVAFDATVYSVDKIDSGQRRRTATGGENSLTAAMPGQVINVLVKEGDEVKRGQTLVILEAMKMEMRVTAPADGRVDKTLVSSGQIVERGQRLIELTSS